MQVTYICLKQYKTLCHSKSKKENKFIAFMYENGYEMKEMYLNRTRIFSDIMAHEHICYCNVKGNSNI